MGVVRPGEEYDREEDENESGPAGSALRLDLDLGLVACPSCRRELPGFLDACPDCGDVPVPRAQLPSQLPPPPAHLLGYPEQDEPDV